MPNDESNEKSEEAKESDVSHSRYGPYTEKVIEMFRHPKNVGEIKDADAIGKVGSPICGDEIWLYLKIEKNGEGEPFIKDIKYQSFGCAAAIATGSMITEIAKGKTLKDALKISRKDVGAALGGLPTVKLHCTLLSTDALDEAIYQYYTEHKIAIPAELEQLHQNIMKGTAIARIKQETDINYCATPEASVKKKDDVKK
jgi:nitrogen fixation protein NifU and related proteins